MKHISFLLAAAWLPIHAGELPETSPDPAPSAPALTAEFRFPERFFDGTPSPPAPPKQRLGIREEDILQSREFPLGERKVIVRKIRPFDLPPLPEPTPPPDPRNPEVRRTMKLIEEEGSVAGFLFLGGTVYSSSAFPGQTRTLLQVWNQRTGKSLQCWSSAPWHQIAGAFITFDGPENRQYALMMSWSSMDIDRWQDFFALRGAEYHAPEIPDFAPQDRSSFVLLPGEDPPPPEDLAPLQAIHDFCKSPAGLARLHTAWEGRERAQKAAEAARLADPPEKKDIVLSTFRIGGAPVTTPAE